MADGVAVGGCEKGGSAQADILQRDVGAKQACPKHLAT